VTGTIKWQELPRYASSPYGNGRERVVVYSTTQCWNVHREGCHPTALAASSAVTQENTGPYEPKGVSTVSASCSTLDTHHWAFTVYSLPVYPSLLHLLPLYGSHTLTRRERGRRKVQEFRVRHCHFMLPALPLYPSSDRVWLHPYSGRFRKHKVARAVTVPI